MYVLVACEESQRVCTAFRERGHEAFSCDIQEPSGGHPEWHILGDVLKILNPVRQAAEFFMKFVYAHCPKICIENPIGYMNTVYRKPDQIIQPYQFGHPVRKSTCLWLQGLPGLKPTKIVDFECIHSRGASGGYSGASWIVRGESGKILQYNNPEVAKIRSKTFEGIARAMAEQWG